MKYSVKRVSALMALLLAISLFAFADATAEGIAVTGAEEILTTGTYSASGTRTWANRVTITGDVTLILEGGANLTAAQGIEVLSGNSLTIDGTGTLIANSDPYHAAIGGSDGKDAGAISPSMAAR